MKQFENVKQIAGVPNMVELTKEDHEALLETIVDHDLAEKMYNEAKLDGDLNAMSVTQAYYAKVTKEHQKKWLEILDKYVGKEFAMQHGSIYRYDIYGRVIFLSNEVQTCSC